MESSQEIEPILEIINRRTENGVILLSKKESHKKKHGKDRKENINMYTTEYIEIKHVKPTCDVGGYTIYQIKKKQIPTKEEIEMRRLCRMMLKQILGL